MILSGLLTKPVICKVKQFYFFIINNTLYLGLVSFSSQSTFSFFFHLIPEMGSANVIS